MSNAKEIRGQIKSVKNTQKITKAMEMVAAAKIRRVQSHMEKGRPYAEEILRVISHLMEAGSHRVHPFLTESENITKVAYILVSTDRGLCGGLNVNLFKSLLTQIKSDQEAGRKVVASVFGRKGISFLSRINVPIITAVDNYPEQPSTHHLIGGISPVIDAYIKGDVQKVYVVSNQYINAMTQQPIVKQLLPATIDKHQRLSSHSWDYIYDPSIDAILDDLLARYIEFLIKQAVSENVACEMSARMVAMKNASDNAGSLINDLQLKYNKARQAAITQELSELVAGADAV